MSWSECLPWCACPCALDTCTSLKSVDLWKRTSMTLPGSLPHFQHEHSWRKDLHHSSSAAWGVRRGGGGRGWLARGSHMLPHFAGDETLKRLGSMCPALPASKAAGLAVIWHDSRSLRGTAPSHRLSGRQSRKVLRLLMQFPGICQGTLLVSNACTGVVAAGLEICEKDLHAAL